VSTKDHDNLCKFIDQLEKSFGELGGVRCQDLINPKILSPEPLMSELVFSMLVWESSIEHAIRAADRIAQELIDLNELRVCTPDELSTMLPSRYPKSLERCQRLICVLNTIFDRENRLSLAHLREMSKREVVDYFSTIDGLPPFVSSRVILLGLGWHAFPIDDWLCKQLARQGVTDSSLDLIQQTQRLERLVRANDALRYYTLIEHWAQGQRVSRSTASNGTDPNHASKGTPTNSA